MVKKKFFLVSLEATKDIKKRKNREKTYFFLYKTAASVSYFANFLTRSYDKFYNSGIKKDA